MAWLPDEQYELMQDTREKAITARSARHTRTHNGKGGAVKFPSDYLSAKERKKLSGECKSYRMNESMSWAEFKELPNDLKKSYVKMLRAKYNVPDTELAKMFGVCQWTVSKYFDEFGLSVGKNGRKRTWDKEGFLAWRGGAKDGAVEHSETPVEDVGVTQNETPVEKDALIDSMFAAGENAEKMGAEIEKLVDTVVKVGNCDNRGTIPNNGTLTFEGRSEDILRTMNDILRNRYVRMSIQWTVVDAPDVGPITLDTDALKKAAKTIDYAILNDQRRRTLNSMG